MQLPKSWRAFSTQHVYKVFKCSYFPNTNLGQWVGSIGEHCYVWKGSCMPCVRVLCKKKKKLKLKIFFSLCNLANKQNHKNFHRTQLLYHCVKQNTRFQQQLLFFSSWLFESQPLCTSWQRNNGFVYPITVSANWTHPFYPIMYGSFIKELQQDRRFNFLSI